jgi:hypothetical protein
MTGTRLGILLLLPLSACTVTGFRARSPFRQSSLDHNNGQPHRARVRSGALQQVADRVIELAKPRDMVLVRQSECTSGRCDLAFRGKPVDRRIFRGTESLTLSYYSRYFVTLRKRGGAVQISAVGVPVLGGEMACPHEIERTSGCRLASLEHPTGEDLVTAVRRQWGYDVSGANEAEMLQGLLTELARAESPPPRVATRRRAPTTAAVTPEDREAYERLRLEGKACYRQRDYRCALDRFRKAQAQMPTPQMRFNIASAQDKLGLAVLAAREYQAYLRQAESVPVKVRGHITQRMAELDGKIGRIRLTARPAEAALSLNGTPQPREPGRPGTWDLIVEPGTHQLDLSCAGYRPSSLTVTLLPGELKRAVVTLQR